MMLQASFQGWIFNDAASIISGMTAISMAGFPLINAAGIISKKN